jgi:hypothetical protein
LFVHARSTTGGQTALVIIQLKRDRDWDHFVKSGVPLSADAIVVKPFGITGTPQYSSTTLTLGTWPADGSMRFFAGQPDPEDSSRFVIPYQIGDQPGIIDGVLNNDLAVSLTHRTGPLAPPPTTSPSP